MNVTNHLVSKISSLASRFPRQVLAAAIEEKFKMAKGEGEALIDRCVNLVQHQAIMTEFEEIDNS